MKILPNYSSTLSEKGIDEEFEPYLTNQLVLLSEHPYQEFIDVHEVELLKDVPSGPEYLSTYVNQWERELPKAISDDERNRRAANLHRAIRTTRYGCHINGSHAVYLGNHSGCYITATKTLRGQKQLLIGLAVQ